MDIEKICKKCMRENTGAGSVCPHCGYDNSIPDVAGHALKPYSILNGKYLVGNVLGEGGFGITYVGLDLNLETRVAIKEFYPNGYVSRDNTLTTTVTRFENSDREAVDKWRSGFVKEARALAKCQNLPGIVGVKDFFEENSTAYIVMEYIEGQTLKEFMKSKGGRISEQELFSTIEPVINSLQKVHETGVIHRDISPDNIMILPDNSMKLLDFGAARSYGEEAEKSLSVMLKPGYAPEEQYRTHGKQGPWSDVYAFSATLYKCITGKTPVESMERMRTDSLVKPSDMGVAISPQREAAILKGMAVYAEDRLQSMKELHDLLYNGIVDQAPNPNPVTTGNVTTGNVTTGNVTTGGAVAVEGENSSEAGATESAEAKKKKEQKLYIILAAVVLIILVAIFIPKGPKVAKKTADSAETTTANARVVSHENGYDIVITNVSRAEAQNECNAAGGQLAVLDDQDEFLNLQSILANSTLDLDNVYFYIGDVTFKDLGIAPEKLILRYEKETSKCKFSEDNGDTSRKIGYICEFDEKAAPAAEVAAEEEVAAAEAEAPAVEVPQASDSYYEWYWGENLSWREAYEKAVNMGGYLAIISSEEELEQIGEYLKADGLQDYYFYVGARREDERHQYFSWYDRYDVASPNPANYGTLQNLFAYGEPALTGPYGDQKYVRMYYDYNADRFFLESCIQDITKKDKSYKGRIGYIVEYGNNDIY